MRFVGALVDGLAMGKSLLNMFSYTAAFSVAAAMGGASETTSVDLAKRSRELSEAHFHGQWFESRQSSTCLSWMSLNILNMLNEKV